MTFREMLRAKDDAEAHADLCAEAMASARADLEAAEAEHAAAVAAREGAHAAIRERLKDRGHHTLTEKDGTVTVYHYAGEPTEDDPIGWRSYQPVPGDEVMA